MEHLIGCIALESLFQTHLNIQLVEINSFKFNIDGLVSSNFVHLDKLF